MDYDDISQLAKELITQVSEEFQNDSSITFSEKDGWPILVITREDSVLQFVPQRRSEDIIRHNMSLAGYREVKEDAEAQKLWVIQQSKKEIAELIRAVASWLGEAMSMVNHFMSVYELENTLGPFRQDIQIKLKLAIVNSVDEKLRELFHLPPRSSDISQAEKVRLKGGKYDYAITDRQMIDALKKLDRFSIRGLAQLLAPDREDFRPSVYDWMKRKKVTREELEFWWRRFHRV